MIAEGTVLSGCNRKFTRHWMMSLSDDIVLAHDGGVYVWIGKSANVSLLLKKKKRRRENV